MLPVLLSIPHGGTATPPELAGRVAASAHDILFDSDPFTIEMYDLGSEVAGVVSSRVARAFVDMNRAPHDRAPANPDGLIKSATCYGRPVYLAGMEPGSMLQDRLVETYHASYHSLIRKYARLPGIMLGLDCHSMAAHPPLIAPDSGKNRPLFCLSNAEGDSCPHAYMERLAACLAEAFHTDTNDIQFNDPFKGGYITRVHGNNPLPWIQIEMNRSWYLSDDYTTSADTLQEMRRMFGNALDMYFAQDMAF